MVAINPASSQQAAGAIQWGRSLLWLSFLGPFFFITYGLCNLMAKQRGITDHMAFGWERVLPVIPWTIIPYWSIDLLYGLSFMLCRSRQAVDRHGLRLLTAQVISIGFFLAFPLRFSFERPVVDGFFGPFFKVLTGMDEPYNQAPSLHISLLVIIWSQLAKLPGVWRWLAHMWCALIGLSVLTTHQHHFFDVPTGAAVGLLCLWLWPEGSASPLAFLKNHSPQGRLAYLYGAGALLCVALSIGFGSWAWWLLWPALAMGLVAGNYGLWGALGFQKHQGRHSLASRLLFAPYTLAAWVNSRLWTYQHQEPAEVAPGVWLGRAPDAACLRRYGIKHLLDLAPELPSPTSATSAQPGLAHIHGLDWLDLVAPTSAQLITAAQLIETHRREGPLLVACALGYSRSASALLAWLLRTGRYQSLAEAEAALRSLRPRLVLSPAHRAALAEIPVGAPYAD